MSATIWEQFLSVCNEIKLTSKPYVGNYWYMWQFLLFNLSVFNFVVRFMNKKKLNNLKIDKFLLNFEVTNSLSKFLVLIL